jgi:hypothetical protein
VSWSWPAAAYAASYEVRRAANPSVLVGVSTTTSFVETSLATNTAYGVVVQGVNVTAAGPLSPSATAFTLARPPSGTAMVTVQATSATLSWSLNTNPAGTVAEVQRSTDDAVYVTVATAPLTAFIDYQLFGCSTYYYRVRNRNGDGVYSLFDSSVQFTTRGSTPTAPSGLAADALAGGRVRVSWTASPSLDVSQYRLYFDNGTGTVNYAAPVAVLTSTETSYTTGALTPGTTYRFALRAGNRCLVEEKNTGLLALAQAQATLPGVRVALRGPAAGKKLRGNRVTLVAEQTVGAVSDLRQVRFQYKAFTASVWAEVPAANAQHPNPATAAPWVLHWDVTGLTATNYDIRAIGYDAGGTPEDRKSVV